MHFLIVGHVVGELGFIFDFTDFIFCRGIVKQSLTIEVDEVVCICDMSAFCAHYNWSPHDRRTWTLVFMFKPDNMAYEEINDRSDEARKAVRVIPNSCAMSTALVLSSVSDVSGGAGGWFLRGNRRLFGGKECECSFDGSL